MASTGFHLPGSSSTGTPAGGNDAWSSTGNIVSDNGVRASVSLFSGTGARNSQNLRGHNFSFSNDVSVDAQIDGVQWRYQRFRNTAGSPNLEELTERQTNSGATLGSNQSNSGDWPTSESQVTYGSSSNSLGASLTAAIVRSSTYGWLVACRNPGAGKNTQQGDVDVISGQVHFTEPPTAPSGVSAVQDGTDVDVSWTDNSSDEDFFEVSVSV